MALLSTWGSLQDFRTTTTSTTSLFFQLVPGVGHQQHHQHRGEPASSTSSRVQLRPDVHESGESCSDDGNSRIVVGARSDGRPSPWYVGAQVVAPVAWNDRDEDRAVYDSSSAIDLDNPSVWSPPPPPSSSSRGCSIINRRGERPFSSTTMATIHLQPRHPSTRAAAREAAREEATGVEAVLRVEDDAAKLTGRTSSSNSRKEGVLRGEGRFSRSTFSPEGARGARAGTGSCGGRQGPKQGASSCSTVRDGDCGKCGDGGWKRSSRLSLPRQQARQSTPTPPYQHYCQNTRFLGYMMSSSSSSSSGPRRRCTATSMTTSTDSSSGLEQSAPPLTDSTTDDGCSGEGGGGGRLEEEKRLTRTAGHMDSNSWSTQTEYRVPPPKPLLPKNIAAALEGEGRQQGSSDSDAEIAVVAASAQQQRAAHARTPVEENSQNGSSCGFGMEAEAGTTGGGEFAEAGPIDPVSESYDRGRWLLGLLILQSTSSFVLDKYQDLLREHVVVTLFLTMLVGAGGNAGNQSAIKVIRGLATGRFTADAACALRVIGDQAIVGFLLGAALAAGGFVRVWVTEGTTMRDASAISSSLFLIVMVSVLLGSALPFGFARAGVDPAHAGTTIQVVMDIVGVVVTCVTCSFVLTQLGQALPAVPL